MKLTPTQQNCLRILKRCVDRAISRHVARSRTRVLKNLGTYSGDMTGLTRALGSIFSDFNGMSGVKRLMTLQRTNVHTVALVKWIIYELYWGDHARESVERELLEDLQANAAEYELLSQMPPARRERKSREPKTLVERRAESVDAKVAQWERKLKLAKTKLAAYRKKQKYYNKKGVVN